MEGGELPRVHEEPSLKESLFPLKLHPRYSNQKEELHAWAEKSLSPHHVSALDKLSIPYLACSMWPMAIAEPPSRLLALLKFMYWLFLVDDEFEAICEPLGLQAESLCTRIMEALFGEDAAAPPSLEWDTPPFISVAKEWWEEVQGSMPRCQQSRFKSAIDAFLQGLQLEKRQLILASDTPPSLQEYMDLRISTYALEAFFVMTEYSLGMELDEGALQSSLISDLHKAAGEHMYCVNDIISFSKEFENGSSVVNIVPVLHKRNCENQKGHVPLQEAVSQAWRMIQERHVDCARLALEIARSPLLASKPGLLSYVECLCLATTGNWAWHLHAIDRYGWAEDIPAP